MCVRVSVSACACACVCLFQRGCVQKGRLLGGVAVGSGGGDEVTRVVVQMSPQLAEPHEWRLL